MEKDFLQSLKLEISKKFTLAPYERIAFHKILGIRRSENGIKILLRDLKKSGLVRRSAVSVLRDCPAPEVSDAFVELLSVPDITSEEFYDLLEHLVRYGDKQHAKSLTAYINTHLDQTDFIEYVCKAIFTLGQMSYNDLEATSFIRQIVTNTAMFERVRVSAIESATSIDDLSLMEPLLKEGNDRIAYAVYRAISGIADREMIKYEATAEDDLFTVMPGQDDRTLLDIRVLLGKMSHQFDGYSRETKTSYIMALILCGHREFIVYTMKALTSNDLALIDLTLYVILAHIDKLRSPDKLLRSLIALPSVTSRDSSIIVDIFSKFFSQLRETKSNMLFRDKIYNYLIVTLDTYFETYRKTFMIPEIMEKNHLQEVQDVRRLIINRFSPEIKRRISSYLTSEDRGMIKKILAEIGDTVSYISDAEDGAFAQFIEMLFEKDVKSREITASRISDIDYEKRYLKNRIVRICDIIGRLSIDESSSNLVKMFNYVKKYYDEEIYEAVTHTLSLLNYPYMLGELEVQLLSGDDLEQRRATRLLPLFSEQRSLNIMLDYAKDHAAESAEMLKIVMSVLVKRDVSGNMAANEIAKKILAENQDTEIKRLAVQLIGQCGFESDIKFLNDLFLSGPETPVKEGIVQAFDFILHHTPDADIRTIIAYMREFLKDPGIRVRMYSCAILLRQKEKEALGTIRDMMVIKNRNIQREIMNVLGNAITSEFAFFLVSLLSDDYAISEDIIPLFKYLSSEEMNELDHFIVNIFKKYEGANYEGAEYSVTSRSRGGEEIKGHKRDSAAVLMIEIRNFDRYFEKSMPVEITSVFRKIYASLIDSLGNKSGSISRSTAGTIIAYFPEVVSATTAAGEIRRLIRTFNDSLMQIYHVHVISFLSLTSVDLVNGEMIIPDLREFIILKSSPIDDCAVLAGEAAQLAGLSFKCEFLPAALFDISGTALEYRELVSPSNFMIKAEMVIDQLRDAETKQQEEKRLIEQNLVGDPQTRRSKNTIAFASAMDQVGKVLRKDLVDISKYVGKRSTDREMIKSVEKLLEDAYRHYMLEVSRTVIE
jgi:hypothetical protein